MKTELKDVVELFRTVGSEASARARIKDAAAKPKDGLTVAQGPYWPQQPTSLSTLGIPQQICKGLVLKYVHRLNSVTGREIAAQIRLPFRVVEEALNALRDEKMLGYTRSSGLNDFEYQLTEAGRALAKHLSDVSTYYGSTPVSWHSYEESVRKQVLSTQRVKLEQVRKALAEVIMSEQMLARIGQGVAAGRTMLLFGKPGNGKTSIAERLIRSFNDLVWIPRAMEVDGDIIRVYDPAVHKEVPVTGEQPYDERWVRIQRPLIVVGGELTLEALEVRLNQASHTYEAPVQMKSNCGVLLIDDFGRQRVPVDALLNRWIVPLEQKVDYLDLPNGKRVRMPFEQLLVFSTNLRPSEVVDEAFLRRIPYKIEIPNPTETQFRDVMVRIAAALKLEFSAEDVEYLLENHYRQASREYRFCHPRDLMLQVVHSCEFLGYPRRVTRALLDEAVSNYFAIG